MGFLENITNPDTAPLHIEQGSDAWDEIRVGRFTSSEIHKLMEPGKRLMTEAELKARPKTGKGSKTTTVPDWTQPSKEAETYIKIKVAEVLTGQPKPQPYAYPLVYGKEKEPEAVEYFEKVTGFVTEVVGFQTFGDHAGGSPDRVIQGTKWGLEIKCPWTSDKQVDYLYLTDAYTLKLMHPDYYWQCVSLMLFMDYDGWTFATYDPRFTEERHKMSLLEIKKEEVREDFDKIVTALEAAVKMKLQMIHTLRA